MLVIVYKWTLAVIFLISASVPTWAESSAELDSLSGATVRVCGNNAYPPVTWINKNQQIDGINVAVIRRLFEPLGVTVDTFQDSNWRRCIKEVELGNVDILSGFKTDVRQQFMTYLDAPIIRESIYLYYPIEHPLMFEGWEALAGLRVGVLMGDSFGNKVDAALHKYPSLEFVSTQDQNLLKLADNRLDVVPMGGLSGQLDLRRLGLEGKIGYTKTDVSDFWYLAISKKSSLIQWLPLLNQRLNQLLKDPEIVSKLVTKYHQVYSEDLDLSRRRAEQ